MARYLTRKEHQGSNVFLLACSWSPALSKSFNRVVWQGGARFERFNRRLPDPDLLSFWDASKESQITRKFSHLWTPKIPGKQGKPCKKNKEFLAKKKRTPPPPQNEENLQKSTKICVSARFVRLSVSPPAWPDWREVTSTATFSQTIQGAGPYAII